MGVILNDLLEGDGYMSSRVASPVGGAWSILGSAHGASDYLKTGASLSLPGSSGDEIPSFKSSAVAGTIAASVSTNVIPTTDGWVAGLVLHAGTATGFPYWVGYFSGATRQISRISSGTDSLGTNILATASDASIPPTNRTAHTFEFKAEANGNLSLIVDGVTVSALGTVNDPLLVAAGRPGLLGRGSNYLDITASDFSGPSFSGALVLSGAGASGSFLTLPPSSFYGTLILGPVAASGTFGPNPGQITSPPLRDLNGLLVNTALEYVAIYNSTTGALIARKTGISTGSDARFTVTDFAISTSQSYLLDWKVAGSAKRRMPVGIGA